MIGRFGEDGNLLPGVHTAKFDEVVNRFGVNSHRKKLLEGMKEGFMALRKAGCIVVYLDGSFVTAKPYPNDYDCCWEPTSVEVDRLDNVLLDFSKSGMQKQRLKYGGEFFPAPTKETGSGKSFFSFFQTDSETGNKKGVVAVDIGDLS